MSNEINIKVKQTNGFQQQFEFKVNTDITIKEFKEIIRDKFFIPPNKQNLILKGRILKDEKRLEDYEVQNDYTILLVEKFHGSSQSNTVPNLNFQSGVGTPGQINYNLLRQPLGGNFNLEQMEQIFSRPEIMSGIEDMMADPNIINAMLENPQIKPMLDAYPEMREMLRNPELIRRMMNPENIRQIINARNMLSNMQGQGMFPNMNMNPYNPLPNPFMMNPFLSQRGMGHNMNTNPNTQSQDQAQTFTNTQTQPQTNNTTNSNTTNTNQPLPQTPFLNPFMFNPLLYGVQPQQQQQQQQPQQQPQQQQPQQQQPQYQPRFPFYNPFYNPLYSPFYNPLLNRFNPLLNMTNQQQQAQNTLSPEQLKEKYKLEIQQLKEMGFDNEEEIIQALIKTNGNVEAAVERMCK